MAEVQTNIVRLGEIRKFGDNVTDIGVLLGKTNDNYYIMNIKGQKHFVPIGVTVTIPRLPKEVREKLEHYSKMYLETLEISSKMVELDGTRRVLNNKMTYLMQELSQLDLNF